MGKFDRGPWFGVILIYASASFAQKPLTWREVRQRFEATSPNLRAGQLGADGSKANEVTASFAPQSLGHRVSGQIRPFPGGPSHGLHIIANALEFENTVDRE